MTPEHAQSMANRTGKTVLTGKFGTVLIWNPKDAEHFKGVEKIYRPAKDEENKETK